MTPPTEDSTTNDPLCIECDNHAYRAGRCRQCYAWGEERSPDSTTTPASDDRCGYCGTALVTGNEWCGVGCQDAARFSAELARIRGEVEAWYRDHPGHHMGRTMFLAVIGGEQGEAAPDDRSNA